MNPDAYADWLRRNGTPEDHTHYDRATVEGILVLARGRALAQEHIEEAVAYASAANLSAAGIRNLRRVGELLLRYQAEGAPDLRPPPPPPPVLIPTDAIGPLEAPLRAIPTAATARRSQYRVGNAADPTRRLTPEPFAVTPPVPAPGPAPSPQRAAPSPRPQVRQSAIASAPPATDQPLLEMPEGFAAPPPEEALAAPAPEPAPTPAPRKNRRKALVNAGIAALAVAALVAIAPGAYRIWQNWSKGRGGATVGAGIKKLERLQLQADFPDGWIETASSPRPGEAGIDLATTLLYRGGSAKDPDHGAFVGILPLTGDLAAGPAIEDDELVKAAQKGEGGIAVQLDADENTYQSQGCALLPMGDRRTALCRGTASRGNVTVSLRTYLTVGSARAVLALFLAKPSVPDATNQADRIVASLIP